MIKKEDIKILLIHVREDKEMADHERKIIIENSGLGERQFFSHNSALDGLLPIGDLKEYDAVIIGGAGGHSVLDDNPFDENLRDIVRYCREKDIPFLGICYGFQIAVQALGGKVIHDKEHMEAGTYTMHRDHSSDNDPLIGDLPYAFEAGCGRNDRAEKLPDDMANYVWSDRCPYHFATYPGSKFFIVQFHPELCKKEDNLLRIRHYKEKYTVSDEEFEKQIKMFHDAPESGLVIKNFVELISR